MKRPFKLFIIAVLFFCINCSSENWEKPTRLLASDSLKQKVDFLSNNRGKITIFPEGKYYFVIDSGKNKHSIFYYIDKRKAGPFILEKRPHSDSLFLIMEGDTVAFILNFTSYY